MAESAVQSFRGATLLFQPHKKEHFTTRTGMRNESHKLPPRSSVARSKRIDCTTSKYEAGLGELQSCGSSTQAMQILPVTCQRAKLQGSDSLPRIGEGTHAYR